MWARCNYEGDMLSVILTVFEVFRFRKNSKYLENGTLNFLSNEKNHLYVKISFLAESLNLQGHYREKIQKFIKRVAIILLLHQQIEKIGKQQDRIQIAS